MSDFAGRQGEGVNERFLKWGDGTEVQVVLEASDEYQGVVAKSLAVTSAVSISDFGFSAAQISAAHMMTITPLDGGVIFLYTGDTPTSTFGHFCSQKSTISLLGTTNISNFKVISESGTVNVTITLEYQNAS